MKNKNTEETSAKIEKEESKVDSKVGEKPTQPMRQIIIETDGNSIHILKAEVSGKIELVAIFQNLIGFLNNQK